MERPPLFDDEFRLSYAKYYFIDPDPLALQAIREPMDEADVLPPNRISEMLAPGYQDVMMGYHIKEGMSYSSFYARLPGVTTEMLDWWFCWMVLRPPTVDPSHDNLRYKIWNPAVHFDQAPPLGGLPHAHRQAREGRPAAQPGGDAAPGQVAAQALCRGGRKADWGLLRPCPWREADAACGIGMARGPRRILAAGASSRPKALVVRPMPASGGRGRSRCRRPRPRSRAWGPPLARPRGTGTSPSRWGR